jgi:uncharacterized membrane protein
MINFLILALFFSLLGLSVEVIYTGVSKIFNKGLSLEERKLAKGTVSIWMLGVYALIQPAVYPFVHSILSDQNLYIKFMVYGVLYGMIEFWYGFLLHRAFDLKPWNYKFSKDKLAEEGYSRWGLIPIWGIVGILTEYYYKTILKIIG